LETYNKLRYFSDKIVAYIARGGVVGGIEVWRIGRSFIFDLHLIKILKLSQSMLIDSADGLG
jgi:hypothetical protein